MLLLNYYLVPFIYLPNTFLAAIASELGLPRLANLFLLTNLSLASSMAIAAAPRITASVTIAPITPPTAAEML